MRTDWWAANGNDQIKIVCQKFDWWLFNWLSRRKNTTEIDEMKKKHEEYEKWKSYTRQRRKGRHRRRQA